MDETVEIPMKILDETTRVLGGIKTEIEGIKSNLVPKDEILRIVEGKLGESSDRMILFPAGDSPSRQHPFSYRKLFCKHGEGLSSDGWNSFEEYANAVLRGLNDGRLQKSLEIGDPSDGGFAVPSEYAACIFYVALEQEIVRQRATVYPMVTNEKKVPATVIGDHSSNLYGGVVAYWKSEGSTLTAAEPQFRSLTLKAQKLTVYGISSFEWFEDATDSIKTVSTTFKNGISWYMDKAFMNGTGAGEPLGILNSACLVSQAKESGQTADTIVYENLAKMVSRMHPACLPRSVWVAHPTTIPQLLTLTVAVGSGGSHIPVLSEKSGIFTILTRPVIFSEKMQPLGDAGDIMLADFSQYAVGMRRDMRMETSPHVYFASDQLAHRAIIRVDGQPLWDEALTLEDGSTTVSPFVVLAERA